MLPLHLNELILPTRIASHNNNNVMDNCASLSCSVLIIAVKDPVLAANRIINVQFRRQQSSLRRLRRQSNQIKSIFRPTNVYCDRFSFTQLLKNDLLMLVRYYNAPRRIVVSVFKLPDNFRVTESNSKTITNTSDSNT